MAHLIRIPLARSFSLTQSALSVSAIRLINTGSLHGSARHKSTDQGRPSSESFTRKESAKRRRNEAKGPTDGDTAAGTNQPSGSKDGRKEALEDQKDKKVFRPARLPIVLCHGNPYLACFHRLPEV